MKRTTLELLDKAMQTYTSQRALSAALGFSPATIGTARTRGRLSPTVAGLLAAALGEDQVFWIALAGIEGDKPSASRDKLLRGAENWRKL